MGTEKQVLEMMRGMPNDGPRDTIRWDQVMAKAKTDFGMDEEAIEEALNVLLDLGLVHEPVLGLLNVVY